MTELYNIIALVLLGYFVGKRLEANHYRSIQKREEKFRRLPTITLKRPVEQEGKVVRMELVAGCIVVSIDYFKRILAALRNIFGGNLSSDEPLVDRARREAVLRMKEQCPGASQIINVRIETSSIFKTSKRGSVGSVEVIAYGTAVTFK